MRMRYFLLVSALVALVTGCTLNINSAVEGKALNQLPNSVLFDITRESITHFVQGLSKETIAFEIFIVTDEKVNWQALVDVLPRLERISFKKGTIDMEFPNPEGSHMTDRPILSRILDVRPVRWSPRRIEVSVEWIASPIGMTYLLYVFEKGPHGWQVVEKTITRVV